MATKIVREGLHLLFYIALIFLTYYLISHFIVQKTTVHGISMENTLFEGDSLIVDRFSHRIGRVQRFDIVVFPMDEYQTNYIKRVIALPGETIQILDDIIYINGVILEESYGKEEMFSGYEGIAKEPLFLEKGEYFVLGDNRNHSSDSRDEEVGTIKKSNLIGIARYRLFPLENAGFLR